MRNPTAGGASKKQWVSPARAGRLASKGSRNSWRGLDVCTIGGRLRPGVASQLPHSQAPRLIAGLLGALLLLAGAAIGGQAEAIVRGKALATSGEPVAGAKVTLSSLMPDGPKETWAATSSAAGTFSLKIPGNKSLGLTVEAPPGGKLAPCAVLGAQPLMVSPGQVKEVTIFLAPATAALKGTVTDADKRPLAGATVTVMPTHLGFLYTRSVTTDVNGRYEITGLAPGGYAVRSVEPPAGTAFVRLSTWRPGGVRAVNIADGQTATEDFQLPVGARLMGRVLDEAGKPLAGALVSCRLDAATEVGKPSVYQMPGQWYSGEATTGADGTYSLGGLTQETYCVEIRSPEGQELAPAVLRGINTPQTGDVKLQDVRLYKGATLIATVVGADGKPLEGAEVAFNVPLGRHGTRVTATSDAKGRVELRGLASGRLSLTVQPPEGSASCQKVFDDIAVVGGLSVVQTFRLPEGAKLTGTVTDPDGRPVAGAEVIAGYGYGPRARA